MKALFIHGDEKYQFTILKKKQNPLFNNCFTFAVWEY